MARTTPAWKRLTDEGWFTSRDEAERWILSGSVRVGNEVVKSCGQRIDNALPLYVKGHRARYVSKGGLKLEGALDAFGVDTGGRVCIDAGASTGGFTDCLIQRGARLVYAVDVGYGQLAGSLRINPAVINLERTNVGDGVLRSLSPTPDLGTVDLSYLSLRRAVPLFAEILAGRGDLICLVKPLFEIDDPAARRTGVIEDDQYAPLLRSLCAGLLTDGYPVNGVSHSPVTGNAATREFFLHLRLGEAEGLSGSALDAGIDEAVCSALALQVYHKGSGI